LDTNFAKKAKKDISSLKRKDGEQAWQRGYNTTSSFRYPPIADKGVGKT
jgi:hypothetical protein